MPPIAQNLARLVDGFDVASGGELKTVLDTPMPSNEISFAGPAKSRGELRQAVVAGIVINLESERELIAAAQAGEALGIRPRVAGSPRAETAGESDPFSRGLCAEQQTPRAGDTGQAGQGRPACHNSGPGGADIGRTPRCGDLGATPETRIRD